MYTRVQDEGKTYHNVLPCCGQIVKFEGLSPRLCFDSLVVTVVYTIRPQSMQ